MLGLTSALPAIWLTAGGGSPINIINQAVTRAGLFNGLVAGTGFGLQLHFLGRIPESAAFSGIAVCMLCGALFLSPYKRKNNTLFSYRYAGFALVAGGISALGLTLYTLSQQGQLAVLSIVIVSLYPLIPVLLGSAVRNEPIGSSRFTGILLSITTTILIVIGGNV